MFPSLHDFRRQARCGHQTQKAPLLPQLGQVRQTAEPAESDHNVLQSQPQQGIFIQVCGCRKQVPTQTVVVALPHLEPPAAPVAVGFLPATGLVELWKTPKQLIALSSR
jgi:hypothetical protein